MPDSADSARARLPLAIIVLTLNEERYLPECLASAVGLGERILVLDSGSADDTVKIALQLGADVATRPFDGYATQRNAALELVDQEWVLFLDADERLTRALRRQIAAVIRAAPDDVSGFWIPRRNIMFGRELRGGGWWPDRQLRLFRRGRAHYRDDRQVHELVELDGESDWLTEPLLHLNYDSFAEFLAKQAHYGELRAAELRAAGVRPRWRTFAGQPARAFWRRFVTMGGWRDGSVGLKLAGAMAWHELQTWRAVTTSPEHDRDQCGAEPMAEIPQGPSVAGPDLDLSVIIVSYNVRDLLLACLASIEAALATSPLATEILVIDNASSDGSPDAVRRRFPYVVVEETGRNLGFGAANNRGIRRARGRVVALLNPDTTVVGDLFGTLARFLQDHPDVGVVGPRTLRPDGTTQSTRRRFPTLLTGFLESTLVQDYWRDNAVLRRYYVQDHGDDELQDVDWLVGACLLVRRDVFQQAGLFDERFFMYSEEVEWCHRARKAGWRVVYVPDASIVHHEGRSSSQDAGARQINFDTSRVLLFEQLHGRGAARVLRAYLLLTYLLRVVIEGGKALLGHKPSLRRERIALYLRAFRSGLRPQSGRR
jgi:GT2 family glycosyltransferase